MSNSISAEEYRAFCSFLEAACGITLGENKHYLVTSRLTRLMGELSIAGLGELVERLQQGRDRALRTRIIDAMTTNETLWFRDNFPYQVLTDELLPEFSKQRGRQVRVWSAACSSGQEPYSISMIAQEYQQKNPGALASGVQIVATDISTDILKEARDAVYDKMSLARGISDDRRKRFFIENGDKWQIRPEIRQRVMFSELNLMQSYVALGRFDVIFIRNVLIYFSAALKRDIFERMAKSLNPGGYLFLGSSESLSGHTDAFDMVRSRSGVYYKLKS